MEFFDNILVGVHVGLQPINLAYCFLGVLTGTLIGVLPGIGPSGAIAILLPLTIGISPASSIILLAGIYYGSMYGGSTTSILVNVPGEAASVITCLDGFQMAKEGRAGPALGIAAFGSFFAGTFSLFGLMFLSTPLSMFALAFGPPEYSSMIILGMTLVIYLAQGSILNAMIMAAFGFLISFIGLDSFTGGERFTAGIPELVRGVDVIPVVIGLFGVSEVLLNLGVREEKNIIKSKLKNLFPNRVDWKDSWKAITRGSIIGFLLGLLPGGSTTLASFASYAMEKKLSKYPERFGRGAIEGVAGPESANNSAFGASLIPLLSLGIPPSVVAALLFSALMIQGIQPGPFLIVKHPDVFWGLVISMYLGNFMLLILNLPLIPLWVQVLKVPKTILFPFILLFCIVGAYGGNNSTFDVGIMMVFGILGYLMRKFRYEPAPLILGFILGPRLESAIRQSLALSEGSFSIFFSRPISITLLAVAALMIFSFVFSRKVKRRSLN